MATHYVTNQKKGKHPKPMHHIDKNQLGDAYEVSCLGRLGRLLLRLLWETLNYRQRGSQLSKSMMPALYVISHLAEVKPYKVV